MIFRWISIDGMMHGSQILEKRTHKPIFWKKFALSDPFEFWKPQSDDFQIKISLRTRYRLIISYTLKCASRSKLYALKVSKFLAQRILMKSSFENLHFGSFLEFKKFALDKKWKTTTKKWKKNRIGRQSIPSSGCDV